MGPICRPVDCIPTGIVYPDRDRCFCPDARIELPGYCLEIDRRLTGSTGNRLEIDRQSTGKSNGNRPRSQKMASSQKCSHRNSVQNGPIEKFPALTATIFVNISVFMSQGPKVDPDPKKPHRHKVVRTEILCRMVRSRNSQLLRRPFS